MHGEGGLYPAIADGTTNQRPRVIDFSAQIAEFCGESSPIEC